ncbi:relaxase/mobilization nuclease domain-containing protein [Christensenellaceae bacterium OttesenSCG-928-M15]|nr:relaxase/mobilization nuclease domain-containing protein [Christensenellaceae bacterium OttesenSCG-928-M15]
MAVTKIIPIRVTIEKSIDYICNPKKTDDLFFIHSEHCVPQTAALTFQHHLNQARAGGNTIGRHLIQSFAPGEVSPETAHEIGKRLAAEILGGEYAFVMATHVDRGHIHNHFVWGAANVVTHKKYHSNKRSYHDIRDASDRLCEEHNLSVIVPQGVGKSYTEYHAAQQGTSWKAKLKAAIDATLDQAADYDDFLRRMESQGYEVKKGAHISFRAPDQQRFTRAKTLGVEYAEDALRRRISEKSTPKQHQQPQSTPLQSVIDIEGSEKIQSSPGYKRWASIFNLKQSAAALNLIHEYGGIEAFDKLYEDAIGMKLDLSQELNGIDAEMKSLSALRGHLRAYGRTKDVFKEYRALPEKKRPTFYRDHKADIDAHRAAKTALSAVEKPVSTAKTVTAHIERLKAQRADANARYRENEAKLKEMTTIRKNLYSIIHQNKGRDQNRSHDISL